MYLAYKKSSTFEEKRDLKAMCFFHTFLLYFKMMQR